jgi:hypothetical protein
MSEQPNLTPHQQAAIARKVLEADVVARAWSDPEFLASLEADPKAALASAGIPVGEATRVVVTRETPGTITLTIPRAPTGEASDDELQAVAGGALFGKGECTMLNRAWQAKLRGDNLEAFANALGGGLAVAVGCSIFWGD